MSTNEEVSNGLDRLYVTALRIKDERDQLREALQEVRDLIEGYVDVVDGDYGIPAPNKAMKAVQVIDSALEGKMSDSYEQDREDMAAGEGIFERPIDDEEEEVGDDVVSYRRFASEPCDQPLDINRVVRRAHAENFELLLNALKGSN